MAPLNFSLYTGIIAKSAALFEHLHVSIHIHMHSHAHTYTCTHTLHTCCFSLQCVHFPPLSSAGESPQGSPSPSLWDRGLGANFCWGRRRVSLGWQKHFSFVQAKYIDILPSKIGSAFNTQSPKVAINLFFGWNFCLSGLSGSPDGPGFTHALCNHKPNTRLSSS